VEERQRGCAERGDSGSGPGRLGCGAGRRPEGSRQAWSGEPATLVVTGEPGVGKSTLLDELVRRADGFHVLPSEALEGDIEPCSSLVGWGVTIDPAGLRASSSFLAAQEIRSILDGLGPDRPVLLRLDDLHGADPESVQAMIALMRRLSGDRLLLAVATRPLGDTHPTWQRWADSAANVTQITLNGLSLAEATDLARRRQPAVLHGAAVRERPGHPGWQPGAAGSGTVRAAHRATPRPTRGSAASAAAGCRGDGGQLGVSGRCR
jgi:hypothetical protein